MSVQGQQRRVSTSPLTPLRQVSPQSCRRNQCLRRERVKLIGLYKESDHERNGNDPIEQSTAPSTLKQRQADRCETAAASKPRLVDPHEAAARGTHARPPLFNLAIDSKLRGCDVVAVRVDDVAPNGYTLDRATVRQKKTGRPVRFELTEQTRQGIDEYLRMTNRKPGEFLFAGRGDRRGLTTRQYARLVGQWVASIGLDPLKFGTHSLRRTKATLIYRQTGNLRAVQLLLGHTKIESTVRYLGIEIDDAIEIAEKIEV
jgi:integrase